MTHGGKFLLHVVWLAMAVAVLSHNATGAELKLWNGGRTPPLALKDLQGQMRSLDQFIGRVVVVNFWATWCEPCVEEMPSLQALKARAATERLVVIGVNLGEGEERIKSFMDKTGTLLPTLLDRDGVAKKDWRVNGVPATFVLDVQGRIRYTFVGALDFSDSKIETQILRLLPKQ